MSIHADDKNTTNHENLKRSSCITVSGPASGSSCIFPFNFKGVSHTKCTTIDGDSKPWCSTKTDAKDDHISGVGAWGYCDANCSDSGSPVCSATSGPASGSTCIFPFNFDGVSYSGCATTDEDPRPWCSTQTDANNNHVSGVGAWGYCDGECSASDSGSTVCSATSGPASGSTCIFPFNFDGVSYSGCATTDDDPRPWCSTKTDANNNHVSGVGAWGYCDANCTGQGTVPPTVVTTITAPQESCQCGVKGGDSGSDYIVGGQETEEHEYPWQVGIVSRNSQRPWCGGTIISSTHVLTAAHCFEGESASSIQVLLGEHNVGDNDFTRVNVAEIIKHPDYKQDPNYDNDYAILRLAEPVTFTNKVSPACLPADLRKTYAGVLATVTGWGTLSSGGNQPTVLQEVDVTVTTNAECDSAYGSITKNMICAADPGKDSCQGDSGGPLIAPENGRQALIGVVSWGNGCAERGFPGVYARVTEKMDWILANTAGAFSSTCRALN